MIFPPPDTAERERVCHRVGTIFSCTPEVALAYVHGSFIQGREFRDIDVAVLLKRESCQENTLRLASRLALQLEREPSLRRYPFDVCILDKASIAFRYAVIKHGVCVFAVTPLERIRFETAVLRAYLDYQDTLEWFNRQFLKDLTQW